MRTTGNLLLAALALGSWLMALQARAVDQCGGHSSVGDPYPCCDNNGDGSSNDSYDGNCTWWSWKKVKDAGVSLPSWGNARSWDDDQVRAVNKSTGFVTFPSGMRTTAGTGSIAVSNTLASLGHVGIVSSFDGSYVTVSEMSCLSGTGIAPYRPNQRLKQYTSGTFQNYVSLLYTYDFWIKATSIRADSMAGTSRPNFDAQFKLKNRGATKYRIQSLALAVHDSSGRFLFNMFRAPGNGQAAIYTACQLNGAACDGLDRNESVSFPISYAYFNSPGSYRIVPKITFDGITWLDLGYYAFTVTP